MSPTIMAIFAILIFIAQCYVLFVGIPALDKTKRDKLEFLLTFMFWFDFVGLIAFWSMKWVDPGLRFGVGMLWGSIVYMHGIVKGKLNPPNH